MFSKQCVSVFICLLIIYSSAQGQSQIDTVTNQAPTWNDPFVSFHVGAVLTELSRDQPTNPSRFNEALVWSYRAGLSVDAINTRWYGLRVELDYVKRGGNEEFAGVNGLLIESKTALHYAQVSFLPAIAKIGWPRFRWFVGAGGYASYLVGSSFTYTFKGGPVIDSNDYFEKAIKNTDLGAVLSTGFYWKKSIVELRYEGGITPLYQYPDGRSVYNRAASFMIHF